MYICKVLRFYYKYEYLFHIHQTVHTSSVMGIFNLALITYQYKCSGACLQKGAPRHICLIYYTTLVSHSSLIVTTCPNYRKFHFSILVTAFSHILSVLLQRFICFHRIYMYYFRASSTISCSYYIQVYH